MRLKDVTISANTGLDAIKRAPIVEYDTGLKCIRIQDISQGKDYESWGYTITTRNDYNKFRLKINDLLIARTGATVGVSYLVNHDYNAVFNNGSIRLRLNKSVNTRFVYYVFQTFSFKQYIDNVSCVATQPNLRVENLLRFTIPDFSLDKQNKIANLLKSFDDVIEVNNKRIRVLEQMAENLYKEWFIRFRFPGHETSEFENGIPKGWEVKTAEDFFEISIGKTPPRKEFDWFTSNDPEAVNWVSISDMRNPMILNTSEQLTQSAIERFNMVVLPMDTVLLSFKLTVGRVSLTLCKCATNEAIAHFQNCHKRCREYLFLYLQSFDYSRLGNTSAIGNAVNSKIVKSMRFIMPDKDTLTAFSKIVSPLFDQIKALILSNNNLSKQRDLLLPRLMSGKLEV